MRYGAAGVACRRETERYMGAEHDPVAAEMVNSTRTPTFAPKYPHLYEEKKKKQNKTKKNATYIARIAFFIVVLPRLAESKKTE